MHVWLVVEDCPQCFISFPVGWNGLRLLLERQLVSRCAGEGAGDSGSQRNKGVTLLPAGKGCGWERKRSLESASIEEECLDQRYARLEQHFNSWFI